MKTALSFKDDEPLFVRLEKIARYSALSPKQQLQYDVSFNNYLAFMGSQEYKLREGIKIGREEGREEGRAEGRAEERIIAHQANLRSAYSLLKLGTLSIDQIAAAMNLDVNELKEYVEKQK